MKVLIATDGSAYARLAEAVAAKLCLVSDADLVVVSVAVPPPPVLASYMPAAEVAQVQQFAAAWEINQELAKRHCIEAVDRLELAGLKSRYQVLEGTPDIELAQFAQSENIDVVVAGSRGQSRFMGSILGSISRKLVNHLPCSVLIAKSPHDVDDDEARTRMELKNQLSTILAYDGSEGSGKALQFLGRLSPMISSALVVSVSPMALFPPGLDPLVLTQVIETDAERSVNAAKQGAQQLEAFGIATEHLATTGRPAEAIVASAKENSADLIVVGANTHGTLERLVLGSVAEEVTIQSECSVLVVRPKG